MIEINLYVREKLQLPDLTVKDLKELLDTCDNSDIVDIYEEQGNAFFQVKRLSNKIMNNEVVLQISEC